MRISMVKLFFIFVKIGAFTFGGGYAMVPIMEREIVKRHKLMDADAFYDALVVCQSLPGPIAINVSTFTGLKIKGWKGALAGVFGTALPSFLIILGVATLLFRYIENPLVEAFFLGVRISVVSLMLYAALKLFKRHANLFAVFMGAMAFTLVATFTVHPFYVVFGAAFFGYAVNTVKEAVDHAH